METKTCQNCKKDFVIDSEDFNFYEKMKVPPPTWCPECRLIRRMNWANERNLYRRKCSLCQNEFLGMFSEATSFPVYCHQCWWSDKWDATQYALDYDPNMPFFDQYLKLRNSVPRAGVIRQGFNKNSEYTNCESNNKNCFLLFSGNFNENCSYCYICNDSRDCFDCFGSQKNEKCWWCVNCFGCYNLKYSQDCVACRDSWFLFGCRNSHDCFGCVNLVNRQYCFMNKQLSKDEYQKSVTNFNFSEMRDKFDEMRTNCIVKDLSGSHNIESSGNWLYNCKNAKNCFMSRELEDAKNVFYVTQGKDLLDVYAFGRGVENIYETARVGYQSANLAFCINCYTANNNLRYCDHCHSCSDLFGCVGMHKKQFCILNKQYSETEFNNLKEKIIAKMTVSHEYGEFFPIELSPFCFNETPAQDFFPLTKEQAQAKGYRWRDHERRHYQVGGNIVSCIHDQKCNHNCTGAFRVTPAELKFYKADNIPHPTLCPNCRHHARLEMRIPPRLYSRTCAKCATAIETSYAPDRLEIVYCKKCYQQEVY